ncbi:F-actin capping protein, beta subunit [Nadsonia fulvescens var. elongata DSM 6958]|uniref:F-actin-capping protein subunit beta n=1 Tax=Nadsonia fulvescens var. elongata DSM 6958 TaxID=857566 RepID=A0A1E3PQJ6_9ASCO|nr:F-actin capping protein, beta subunit [Nadsonia fulvescens var. elongata DSM 6958]
MSDESYDAALDLFRRLDPQNISKDLATICKIVPGLAEDLLSSVDQPLGVNRCTKTNKSYLTCDYNRDGDSFRSPWSGEYEPAVADAPMPSSELRKLEILANDSFDIYRDLYYEGGISSVYLWDLNDGSSSFAGVVLLKKKSNNGSGAWDSIHVFEFDSNKRNSATYRITSTVILDMVKESQTVGKLNLSGNLTRQLEKELPVDEPTSHISNIGTLIEDIESKIRNSLQEVYFGKARDIIGECRTISTSSENQIDRKLQGELVKGIDGN